MSFKTFIYAYLLGGLTFVPGVILVVIYYVYTYGSTPIGDPDPLKRLKNLLAETEDSDPTDDDHADSGIPTSGTTTAVDSSKSGMSEASDAGLRNRHQSISTKPAGTTFPGPKLTEKHLTGWLTIRRSFNPPGQRRGSGLLSGNSTPGGSASPAQAGTETVIGNFKQGLLEPKGDKPVSRANETAGTHGDQAASTGVAGKYSTMLMNSYRSIVDGNKPGEGSAAGTNHSGHRSVLGPSGSTTSVQPRQPAIKEFVFCALKGNVLFMYEDASMDNCLGVIGIEGYSVSISRGDSEDEDEDDMEYGEEIYSSEDSDAMTAGEQEMLKQSGLSSEEKHKVRSKATKRKRKREARGGSEFMDGELFAKRNAVVLRAVPVKPRMRRNRSSVTTVPESGIQSGPAADRRGGLTSTSEVTTAPGINAAGDLAVKVRKSATLSVPTERPELQRKSSLPTGPGDKAVLPGDEALGQPHLGPGAGPPIMALTRDMDIGLVGDRVPGDPGVPEPKTVLQDEPAELEYRRKEKRRREEKRLDIEARPWYIFARNNVKQEQWYHALLLRSHPNPPANSKIHVPRPTLDKIFSSTNMQKLIDTLNEDSDSIPVRWLNAMLGRIFLGICGTAALEAFIINKVMKKVRKVKTPSFLGDIVVKEIDVGTTPPYFSKPMLKELTAEGEASFEVALHYTGNVRITVATSAIIPTAFGFKPYSIPLELVVVVQAVHGNVCVRIKKPPSNRIWWGFTKPPKIDLRVLPVVSDRKIQINMVLKAIEKQIRDAVNESIVLPNMDDLAFFDTRHLRARGGLFDEAGKHKDVEIKADLGPDGLEPIPLHKNKPTTGESDLARKASIQSRQPASMAVQALDLPQGKATKLARTEDDAHSIGGASQHSITKSISESTRKWLATKTGGVDSSTEDDHRSSEPATPASPSTTARRAIEKTGAGFEIRSSGTSTPIEAVDTSVEAVASGDRVMDRAQDDDVALDQLPSSKAPAPQGFVPRGTLPSTTAEHDTAATGSAATAAALMNNIRARTADKKALQSSVNEARDAMRKWGKNWAAKRTVGGTGQAGTAQEAEISQKLQAVEQQIQKTKEGSSPSSSKSIDTSPRMGTSLQERLALAANLASSPPTTAPSLPRQSVDGHRPDAASMKSASSPEDRRRESMTESRPVRQQPAGMAAMTVPRVPRRPDAVTAISSEGQLPDTTKTSSTAFGHSPLGTSPKGSAAIAIIPPVYDSSTLPTSASASSLSQLVSPSKPLVEVSRPPSRSETPERTSRPPSLPARSRATSIKGLDLPQEATTSSPPADLPPTPSKTAQDTLKGLVAADERSRGSSKSNTPTTD